MHWEGAAASLELGTAGPALESADSLPAVISQPDGKTLHADDPATKQRVPGTNCLGQADSMLCFRSVGGQVDA